MIPEINGDKSCRESGFPESADRKALRLALGQAGFMVEAEVPIPVSFLGFFVRMFRAGQMVGGRIILELMTSEQIRNAHEAQRLPYLRASEIFTGLVMRLRSSAKFR